MPLYLSNLYLHLEEATREEGILERSELQVVLLGTGAAVLRTEGGGAKEGPDVSV